VERAAGGNQVDVRFSILLVDASFTKISSEQVLVCFAVKEEAKFFSPVNAGACKQIVTGMGVRNAGRCIEEELSRSKPRLVITAGFAGGLNPGFKVGTVVFDEDAGVGMGEKLLKLNAVKARFYCAERVAVSSLEKQKLWQSTKADAVEMESSIIRTKCLQLGIPSVTIRVISDAANEDLPLDFNSLMTADNRIDFAKLTWKLLTNPQKIPDLMKLQKKTAYAARNLGNVLQQLLVR
jgi:adenosylhomocysteine nucleosidase